MPLSTDRFVIFPYDLSTGKAELFTESQIFSLFPKGYSYLKECETELRGREKGRFNNDKWYMFGRGQGLNYGGIPKLLAPEISLGGNFSYDKNGHFYSTTKIYGYIKKEQCNFSYMFLLGLLNSNLFWFFIQKTGYVLRGGYYTFKTNYVSPFPIPDYNMTNKKLISIVENEAEVLLKYPISENEALYHRRIIDNAVYTIYNLSEDEKRTISLFSL